MQQHKSIPIPLFASSKRAQFRNRNHANTAFWQAKKQHSARAIRRQNYMHKMKRAAYLARGSRNQL